VAWLDFSAIDVVNAFAALLALAVLVIGLVLAYRELKELHDQMCETVFLEYSKRYNEIAQRLPLDIFRREFDKSLVEKTPGYPRAMKAYVELCSEEIKLACRGRIPPQVWQDWEEEIRTAMDSPAGIWAREYFDFKREYKTVGLFLDGKERGLDLARIEYERRKRWNEGRFA